MSQAHFRSSGNVVKMLGEQLVSNKFIALLELIKNAYDADAKSVVIEFKTAEHPIKKKPVSVLRISDNGNGMTNADIEQRWLVLGTPEKEKDRFSPGGRRLLGRMGIGRFAIQRLGAFSTISTVPNPATLKVKDCEHGKSLRFSFDVDWDRVVNPDQVLESYTLSIKAKSVIASDHGFELNIFELRDDWTKEDVNRLQREVSTLLPPDFSEDFSVNFSHWRFAPETATLTSAILKCATYSIKGTADGRKTLRFVEGRKKGKMELDTSICGPFSFEIYAFDDRQLKDDFRGLHSRVTEALREFHGIKLYRDGFRVKPYGDKETDWLGLDAWRVKLSTRVDSKSTVGIVRISSDDNPDLIDQTNREGIIEGPALAQLKHSLFQIVNRLSIKNVKWHKVHTTKGTFQTAKQAATKATRGSEASKSVKAFVDTAERVIRSLEETNADLRSFASIGLSMVGVGHDLMDEARLAKALVNEIAENPDDPSYVRENSQSLKAHIDVLWSFIQLLEEFGQVQNRETKPIFPDESVKTFFKRYSPLLKRSNDGMRVKLKLGAPSAKVSLPRRNLESILINLTTNAIQALETSEPPCVISVETTTEGKYWVLHYADSGPGVHPSVRDTLFELGVTTKTQGGSGLGLHITRTLVENARGRIDVAPSDDLPGAKFAVKLPLCK